MVSRGRRFALPRSEYLGLIPSSAPDCSFLLLQTLGGNSMAQVIVVLIIHMGNLKWVPSCCGHLESGLVDESSLFSMLYVCF